MLESETVDEVADCTAGNQCNAGCLKRRETITVLMMGAPYDHRYEDEDEYRGERWKQHVALSESEHEPGVGYMREMNPSEHLDDGSGWNGVAYPCLG